MSHKIYATNVFINFLSIYGSKNWCPVVFYLIPNELSNKNNSCLACICAKLSTYEIWPHTNRNR